MANIIYAGRVSAYWTETGMARMASDAILMTLADQIKAKEPESLTNEEKDFLTKWEPYAKRKGLA